MPSYRVLRFSHRMKSVSRKDVLPPLPPHFTVKSSNASGELISRILAPGFSVTIWGTVRQFGMKPSDSHHRFQSESASNHRPSGLKWFASTGYCRVRSSANGFEAQCLNVKSANRFVSFIAHPGLWRSPFSPERMPDDRALER